MLAADRLPSTTPRADASMASSAMPMDTGCKTIACGRCALATTMVQDRAIGCSLLQVSAARRTHFLASSHLRTKVPRRTTGTIGRGRDLGKFPGYICHHGVPSRDAPRSHASKTVEMLQGCLRGLFEKDRAGVVY